jgi:hypothetical protein
MLPCGYQVSEGKDAECRAIAAPATKAEQRPAVRILRQHRLHQRRQSVEALAHVGRAAGQEHPRARRRAQRQRPPSSAKTTRRVAASAQPVTRMLAPEGSVTSIVPGVAAAPGSAAGANASIGGVSATTCTGTNPDIAVASICFRQVYSSPVLMPCRSAIAFATAPGSRCEAVLRTPHNPQPLLGGPGPPPDRPNPNFHASIPASSHRTLLGLVRARGEFRPRPAVVRHTPDIDEPPWSAQGEAQLTLTSQRRKPDEQFQQMNGCRRQHALLKSHA